MQIFQISVNGIRISEEIILHLRSLTSTSMRAVVVIDAGIATEENLAMLSENNFDYVCVSRSKLKDYRIDPTCCPVEIEYSFRTLKTDLDLRPIYRKKDPSTLAHLQRNNTYHEHPEIGFDGFSKSLR
jgi:hypothetical protein